MKIEQHFSVPLPAEQARKAIERFLILHAFQLPSSGEPLRFVKGNPLLNMVTPSPRSWYSSVGVELSPTAGAGSKLAVRWEVVTTGQLVTHWDAAYWRDLIRALPRSLTDPTYDGAVENSMATTCLRRNLALVACALGLCALTVYAVVSLGLGLRLAGWAAVAVCAGALLPFRCWGGVAVDV